MAAKKRAKKVTKQARPQSKVLKKKVAKKRVANAIPLENEVAPEQVTKVLAQNEILQGKYCNVGVFKHTPREFILDFFWDVDGLSILTSRVVTNPAHAKEIHKALGENIERYEKRFGEIEVLPKQ